MGDPVVVVSRAQAPLGKMIAGVALAVGVLVVMFSLSEGEDDISMTVALFLFVTFTGSIIMLLVPVVLLATRRTVGIGSSGVTWRPWTTKPIAWAELTAVGIRVVHRDNDSYWSSASPVVSAEIRLAGTVPGLPGRLELAHRRNLDETHPFTHTIPLLVPAPATPKRLALISRADAALQRYAGGRYVPIEWC